MLQLRTFGGLALCRADAPLRGAAAQPRRLALLAALAVAGPRGIRRDRLLALLWPSRDTPSGRQALSQALYALRRDAGGAPLVAGAGTEELRLDSAVVRADVVDFQTALARGAREEALSIYSGPFLDGVFLTGDDGAFEQWVEAARARLHARAVDAAGALADAAQRAGATAEALRWARHAVELAPGDEPATRRLMLAHERAGDLAGALAAYERLAARLAADVGAQPSAATRALVERLAADVRRNAAPLGGDEPLPDAEQCCARGTRLFREFGARAFADATGWFQRALAQDPECAAAHAGLGAIHAFRYIARAEPESLARAEAHLSRATQLDPEAAEPHVWLSYVLARRERFAEAERAARRALALDSGNPVAHYMLGMTLLVRATMATSDVVGFAEAVTLLRHALDRAPTLQPAALGLGCAHLLHGDTDGAAAPCAWAAQIEESEATRENQFVGGLLLHGVQALRAGDPERAAERLQRAVPRYAASDHVYAAAFNALAHCALAEVALHAGAFDDALAAYDRARAVIEAHPGALAMGWVLVRAQTGRAGVLAESYQRGRAERELRAAEELLDSRALRDFGWMWECGPGPACVDVARALVRLRAPEQAASWLARAEAAGWADLTVFTVEPWFAQYAEHPALVEVRRAVAARAAAFRRAVGT
jgi:DNA-binding SARP family transcriptional activator